MCVAGTRCAWSPSPCRLDRPRSARNDVAVAAAAGNTPVAARTRKNRERDRTKNGGKGSLSINRSAAQFQVLRKSLPRRPYEHRETPITLWGRFVY